MNLPVVIVGGGGHARVLIAVLQTLNKKILGVIDSAPDQIKIQCEGIPVLGKDEKILDFSPASVELVNGIGSVSSMGKRREVFEKFKRNGYAFASVIHPSAIIMDSVCLGEGVQIMAGAIVQTGCVVGDNCIINTGAIVDHDCEIGGHVHLAPGVVLSGGVRVGEMTHVGTSASAIQGVVIGRGTVVGAGAVVVNDIPSGSTVVGIPAREMKK